MALIVWTLVGVVSALLCTTVDAEMKCFHFTNRETISGRIEEFGDSLHLTNVCPRPLIGDTSQEFCCYDVMDWLHPHCCDFSGMVLNWSIIAVIVLIILMLLSTVVSCFCCLCCPFCSLYKRRQGRVYRNEPIVTVNQTTHRTNTEYTPIVKSTTHSHRHLPPGARQVLPS